MSDTPTVPAPSLPPLMLGRGTVVTSIVAQVTYLIIFAGLGYLAYMKVEGAAPVLYGLAGVAATNASQVVTYWLGSSSGSAKKTDLITAHMQGPK